MFRTQALPDANCAHPGCNCPVVGYTMPLRRWRKLLGPKGLAPGGVADLRRTPLRPGRG